MLFFIGTIFLAGTAFTSIIFPDLLGKLVDGAFVYNKDGFSKAPDASRLQQVAYWFIYLFIAQAVFSFLRIWLYVRVTENMTFNIRRALYRSVLLQEMFFFAQNRVGDLMSRFSADIGQIQDTFTTNIAMFLRQLLIIVFGVVLIFMASAKLAMWMLATVPVVVVISLFFGRYIRKISRKVQDMLAQNNVVIEETLAGISNVKSFSNEAYEMQRYGKNSEDLRRESIFRGLLRGAFSSFIIICLFGSIVLLIFIGLNMVRSGELPIGTLFKVMMLTAFVGGSIGGLAEQFVQIQKTLGAVERVLDLIDKPTEPILPEAEIKEKPSGDIEVKNLSFYYPSRPEFRVLESVDFFLEQGKSLAIVGPSGAGKSTLIALLYRFYAASEGSISIGGENIEEKDLKSLRSGMALVPQEIILFGGTIEENIRYGKPTASFEEVEEAARQANAAEFILSFPEGYQTLVGDRGIKLSGGQRQRIAIARAILKDPEILLLDEATSALDTESEKLVQNALHRLMQNRTSIVIAHRLSTIRNADRIIVLRHGKIVEQGSHDELLHRKEGIYRHMVEQQQEPAEFFEKI